MDIMKMLGAAGDGDLSEGNIDMMELAAQEFMPKFVPMLQKAETEIKKLLGNNDKSILIQIEPDSGQIFLMIAESKRVELDFDGEKDKVIPLTQFMEMAKEGDIRGMITLGKSLSPEEEPNKELQ